VKTRTLARNRKVSRYPFHPVVRIQKSPIKAIVSTPLEVDLAEWIFVEFCHGMRASEMLAPRPAGNMSTRERCDAEHN
jgi:hypothetical protein